MYSKLDKICRQNSGNCLSARERMTMISDYVERTSMRLLAAFDELATRTPLNRPVPLGTPNMPEDQAAAPRARIHPLSPECAAAVRYLLEKEYIEPAGAVGDCYKARTELYRVRTAGRLKATGSYRD